MNISVRELIQRLADCYASHTLGHRHRVVTLRGRKCQARIMYTLLGYEVKAGRRRITCPDLITARYLRLFAEIGMPCIGVPYDPTRTETILPEMEALFEAARQQTTAEQNDSRSAGKALRTMYGEIRAVLLKAEREETKGTVLTRKSP
jgi:hypothetical protein